MRLNKTTMLHLRSALIMLIKAIDAALLECYGWTPRAHSNSLTDRVE